MGDRRTMAALCAAILLATSMSGGSVAVGPGPSVELLDATYPALADEDGNVVADRVAVADDGTAAFVFHEETGLDTTSGETIVALERHEAALTAIGTTTEPLPAGEAASGSLALTVSPTTASSVADIAVAAPPGIDDLVATATVTATDRAATTDVEMTATLTEDYPATPPTNATGTLTWTASTIQGEGVIETRLPAGNDSVVALDERREVTLTEDDDRYLIEAFERRHVGLWERERWETREDAERSLNARYDELAIALGGQASVTVDSYAYHDEHANRSVEVGYRVELVGVADRIGEAIAEQIAPVTADTLDDDQRRVLGDRIAEAHVDEIAVVVEQSAGTGTIAWNLSLSDTDSIVTGVAEIGLLGPDPGSWDRDAIHPTLDAKAASDFRETVTWTLTVNDSPENGDRTVEATIHSEADNWSSYLDELAERDREPLRGVTTIEQTATMTDDVLAFSAAAETTDHRLAILALTPLLDVVGADTRTVTGDERAIGDFGVPIDAARIEATIETGSVTAETVALADGPDSPVLTVDGREVAAIIVESKGDETILTVVIDGAMTEIAAHDHPFVGDDTIVTDADGDARPGHDLTYIREFVGADPDDPGEGLSPATAGVVIVVAGLGGAVGLRPRTHGERADRVDY